MKDVKVDVRVNVGVDTASVILLLASSAMALFMYKQHKEDKQDKEEKQDKQDKARLSAS